MSNINWRIKVADKETFWDTEEIYNQYKFQRNLVFGQYRVVSPDKFREAWGHNRAEIYADFIQISGKEQDSNVHKQITEQIPQSETFDVDPIEKLEKLAELYKDDIITREEYEEIRQKYVAMLK